MTPQLNRLALAFGAAFLAIALATGYWAVVRGDALLQRADNPRPVLAERRVPRGAIYDRTGAVLADVTGPVGALTRHYPYPQLAPLLGYVSPLFGSAGVEAALDPVLHGSAGVNPFTLFWQSAVLGRPQPGRAVKLSIELALQQTADKALGSHVGAIVVLNAQTGDILALASHPTYDANAIDDHWQSLISDAGSPLLNRATLALYQPGGALAPLVVAGALQAGLVNLDQPFPNVTQTVAVGGQALGCRIAPAVSTLALSATLTLGCPAPLASLGQSLGAAALAHLFDQFQLFTAPSATVQTTAVGPKAQNITDPALAAIGQGQLTVTPLRMALVTATLARAGLLLAPHLVLATQDAAGQWQTEPAPPPAVQVVSPPVADQAKALMRDGLAATALTGSGGKTLVWFLGFAPFDDPKYAIAVLLEDGDPISAAAIGNGVLAVASSP